VPLGVNPCAALSEARPASVSVPPVDELERTRQWLRDLALDVIEHDNCQGCRRNAAQALDETAQIDLVAQRGLSDPRTELRPSRVGRSKVQRIDANPVDPRGQTGEVTDPRYRVHFWDGCTTEEWELQAVDAPEALAWAEGRCDGRTYCLFAAFPSLTQDGVTLVRLAGWEGPFVSEDIRPPRGVDRPLA
jgi:hypothetical protein